MKKTLALLALVLAASVSGQNPCAPPNCTGGASTYAAFASALRTDLAATAPTGVVDIVIVGDSLSYCTLTTCSATFATYTYVDLMRSYIQAKWGNHGTGVIPFRAHVDATSSNATLVASVSGGSVAGCGANTFMQTAAGGDVDGQACYSANTTGMIITSTSQNYDHLNVLYELCCNAGGFDLKIDGSDLGTFANTASASCCTVGIANFAAPGGLGNHTFTMTANAGTTQGGYLYGVEGVIGSTGVSIHNLSTGSARGEYYSALNGSTTDGSTNTLPSSTWMMPMTRFTPNIAHTYFIIPLGTNDLIDANVTQYGGNMNAIVSDLVENYNVPASHILLVSPFIYEGPFHTNVVQPNDQTAYTAAAQRIGVGNAVGYLNPCAINAVWCSFTAANAAGYVQADVTHPTGAGQAAWWNDLQRALGI